MGHSLDLTKAIESIPGRRVPTKIKILALGLIVVGVGSTIYGFTSDFDRAGGAFITNFMFFNGIAMGGFMLTPIALVTHSRWPRRVKRFSEALGLFVPVMFVLFITFLLAGGIEVYPWMHEGVIDPNFQPHKTVYLTKTSFIARQFIGQGILCLLTLMMIRASLRGDMATAKAHLGEKTPTMFPWNVLTTNLGTVEEESQRAFKTQLTIAPILCVLYALLYSMIAVDVSMSLSPHWYANMFPAWVFMSSIWSGLVSIAVLSLLARDWVGVKYLIPSNVYHDLGKLTFAFCMFWGYTTFAQYLPIWYGNMIEEIGFVLLRTAVEPWASVAKAVFLLCFLAPWTILLSRGLKKIPAAYLSVAAVILVGIWLERFLVNMPSVYKGDDLPLGITEIGMAAGLLGGLIWVVTHFLARVPGAVISDAFIHPDPDDVHVLPQRLGKH